MCEKDFDGRCVVVEDSYEKKREERRKKLIGSEKDK